MLTTMLLEELLNTERLKNYKSQKVLRGTTNGGIVLNLLSVDNGSHWIGMLTAYDKNGLKSENAVSFSNFMKIVGELENVLADYRVSPVTGRLFGWKPAKYLQNFLYNKKVHRLFFLEESQVFSFLREYTDYERADKRNKEVVEVVVLVG